MNSTIFDPEREDAERQIATAALTVACWQAGPCPGIPEFRKPKGSLCRKQPLKITASAMHFSTVQSNVFFLKKPGLQPPRGCLLASTHSPIQTRSCAPVSH